MFQLFLSFEREQLRNSSVKTSLKILYMLYLVFSVLYLVFWAVKERNREIQVWKQLLSGKCVYLQLIKAMVDGDDDLGEDEVELEDEVEVEDEVDAWVVYSWGRERCMGETLTWGNPGQSISPVSTYNTHFRLSFVFCIFVLYFLYFSNLYYVSCILYFVLLILYFCILFVFLDLRIPWKFVSYSIDC